MKTALVHAYIDNNLGDDLFLSGITERYKDVEFSFNYANNSTTLREKNNVKYVELNFLGILKNVKSYDAFVLIGGSMFQQLGSMSQWVKKWLKLYLIVLFFRLRGKKVVFMGFNFGPYNNKLFFCLYKSLFKLVNYLSVRDEKTFNLFKENKRVRFYPDIVFGLKLEKLAVKQEKNNIGLSIMDFGPNVKFQQQYEDFLINVLKGIDKSYTINVYTFQNSRDINDEAVAQRVLEKAKRDANVYNYRGENLEKFLRDFSKNEVILSSRFHSLVLALIFRQNFVSINYNIKIDNLLDFIGLNSLQIKPLDLENKNCIVKTIDRLNSKEKIRFNKRVSDLDNEAVKHFEYLDKLFEVKN
ncbi:hypothetical protein GBO60_09145 [Pediococcus acidilactici]|uniref:polysaccharide pyruvyl transferase family protein n=1 Tax=Pediococcus acidilactici TaxID=1254 RepID=UPI0013237673|nr:polysaccharide pyruvyl transferase family protein [Pediococcus acidilactici]KAF0369887.1 hypothetical protein GBO60_09145 [Pediococcus acidilactici]KAF0388529.1 hypothetical protein GBO67_09145 [Pediococcus acidilactici]